MGQSPPRLITKLAFYYMLTRVGAAPGPPVALSDAEQPAACSWSDPVALGRCCDSLAKPRSDLNKPSFQFEASLGLT